MKSTNRWGVGVVLAVALAMKLSGPAAARADVDEAVLEAEEARIAAVAKATPSVLAIFARGAQGGGSGVVISPDGYALSNFHVTKPAGDWMKCGMADGRLYDAVIVGIDPVGDVALIKLLGRDDFPHAELADSDQVRVGDWCFAAGNPFLLATDFQPTITWGVVSGVHRYQYPAGTLLEYADCIQTDASINPGNSGGPLFDAQGRLIGINGRGSFEKRGRVNVGVGYAISINQIKNFLGHLKAGKIVDHATMGAIVSTAEDGRVVVADILESSDAYRRGLRYDDEIVSFAGRPIRTVNAFKNALGIFPKGWRVPLVYRRDGQTREIHVRLAGVHRESELISKVQGQQSRRIEPNPPRRRDGDPKPQDDPPEPKPGDDPLPRRVEDMAQAPMPADIKKQFEARSGYANFYFNRLNQQRVWTAFQQRGDFAALRGPWTFHGTLAAGGEARIVLDGKQPSIELPTGDTHIVVADGLDAVLNPPGSGGLLAALHLWRKLLVEGPGRFGQVIYVGTGPLPGETRWFDILRGTTEGVHCDFMFDPDEGLLVALEMYPFDDADPCEVYFGDYRESGGRFVPHRMEVRHGNDLFAVFLFTTADLQEKAP